CKATLDAPPTDDEARSSSPGRHHVQMTPSWHAVTIPSSRKIRAVSLSCDIFLHIKGSRSGHSSSRGQASVPISFNGSLKFRLPSPRFMLWTPLFVLLFDPPPIP